MVRVRVNGEGIYRSCSERDATSPLLPHVCSSNRLVPQKLPIQHFIQRQVRMCFKTRAGHTAKGAQVIELHLPEAWLDCAGYQTRLI
jgi:hypothetical protein